MDVTLIKKSRGDKSIPVVTLAKLQANVDLMLVLHFGYLHRVILVSVPVVCRADYFSFLYSLLCTLFFGVLSFVLGTYWQCQKHLATFSMEQAV